MKKQETATSYVEIKKVTSWTGMRRFLSVIALFAGIFWSFYALRWQRLWRSPAWIQARRQELLLLQSRRFRSTAIQLGGLLIKLGQFLSTRVDMLPQIVTKELANLQDEVPPVPFSQIRQVAEAEFGQPLSAIYRQFEEVPLASASLGQAHVAVLPDGRTAAVKIQRPGIGTVVEIDLLALRQVVSFLKSFTSWEKYIDFDAIFREFADTSLAELDYESEGRNAERIAVNSSDPDLIIPQIYWEYTTRRVLTLEYLAGIKITDYQHLGEVGIDRRQLARHLLEIYVKQILVDGFFHADPHPGNLFVSTEGKIIMIDFGMMGSISPALRDNLVKMAMAMVKRDYPQVVNYLKKVGFLRPEADNAALVHAIGLFIDQLLGSVQDIFSADLSALLEDLEHLLYEQPFQVPANFTFLGRALGTLYGICIGLDPKIDFLETGKPYVLQLAPVAGGVWQNVKEKGAAVAASLIELPPLTERVLRSAERGDLRLRIQWQPVNQSIQANTQAVLAVGWALCYGFTLLTAAYLYVHQFVRESYWALLGSLLLLVLFIARSSSRSRHSTKVDPAWISRREPE